MHDEWQLTQQGETTAESDKLRPEGVGGWLLYFSIMSIFLGPLASLSAISKSINPYWLSCYVGLVIFSIAAGVAILARAESALTLVRLDLTARAFYGLSQIGWALHLRSLHQASDLIASEIGRAIGSFLVVAIWFWYFKVSSRVKQTFGRNI